ncbi:XRE family transcriptional regulator [Limosilactobacillus fermentum]|nr:XRE family transcriptional regulator [Limosilactobacillus fermentum]QAR24769.1 XRE family transcriptional regulator [Limosilactobacillus fermentum]QAR24842.1 XRE family transcriptional regulator [Limosilactobacillus fermentum]
MNVTRLREQRGWSIQELASRLNLDRTYLSKSESGKRSFKVSEVNQLAEIFGVSTDYLLGRKTPDNNDIDLDRAIDNAMSFDGKPVTDHDRKIMKQLWKAYMAGKE